MFKLLRDLVALSYELVLVTGLYFVAVAGIFSVAMALDWLSAGGVPSFNEAIKHTSRSFE